jgi:hypothetical protein
MLRKTISALELWKYAPPTLLYYGLSGIFKISVNEFFELEERDWVKQIKQKTTFLFEKWFVPSL